MVENGLFHAHDTNQVWIITELFAVLQVRH